MDIDGAGKEQLKFAVGDPRQVEQVVDESSFEFDIASHHAELTTQLRLDAGLLLESSGRHEHGSKGVRNSCERAARNLSFARLARSASFFASSSATASFLRCVMSSTIAR